MAHMAVKPIHWFLGYFRQPCTRFILTYFWSFNFQLSTNKVVVVVLLPRDQKWTSGHLTNVDIFTLLCQLILRSYILVIGLLKVAKTYHLLCDVICLLSYSHGIWFFKKIYCKISSLHTELPTCEELFIIRRPFRQRFIQWFVVICISTSVYWCLRWCQYNFADLFSYVLNLFGLQSKKYTQLWIIFAS